MRRLLESRFHLRTHTEVRELPIYALVVDKAGLKIRPVPQTDAIGQNPFRMTGAGRLAGTAVTAAMLANVLSDQLGRSVQDQTGITGVFNFTLEWRPDSTDAAALPAGPSLFTAMPEQLGLKLEARKGPVEVLVIDSVDNSPVGN